MTRQQPFPNNRRRPGEVAGNATAEFAAVCCCVPCAVMDMVALATYKVPAGLWKKAVKNTRKKRLQKQQKIKKNENTWLDPNKPKPKPKPTNPETVIVGSTLEEHLAKEELPEVDDLEEEMWARFSITGFWRSGSQNEEELQTGKKDR